MLDDNRDLRYAHTAKRIDTAEAVVQNSAPSGMGTVRIKEASQPFGERRLRSRLDVVVRVEELL